MSFGVGSKFNLLELCVQINNNARVQKCAALIDSGATHNFISANVV